MLIKFFLLGSFNLLNLLGGADDLYEGGGSLGIFFVVDFCNYCHHNQKFFMKLTNIKVQQQQLISVNACLVLNISAKCLKEINIINLYSFIFPMFELIINKFIKNNTVFANCS